MLPRIPQKYKYTTREYYEYLYAHKLENLEEINKFLYTYTIQRLSQEEIYSLNRSIMSFKTESVISSLPTPKKPRTRLIHNWILTDVQRRAGVIPTETISKIWGEETPP